MPTLLVTRSGSSYDLKTNMHGAEVRDIHATESSLHYVVEFGASVTTFHLRREGAELVGTGTMVMRGQQWDDPVRMVRNR